MSDPKATGGKIWTPPEPQLKNPPKQLKRPPIDSQTAFLLGLMVPIAIAAIGLTVITNSLT